jgi:hypothetical protein
LKFIGWCSTMEVHASSPLRLLPRWSRSLVAVPLLLLPFASLPAAAQTAPATEAQMQLYTRIAAVNVCIARGGGVDFDKAVAIAGETIAQVLQGLHGGKIQQVGTQTLTIEDLRRGAVNSAVIGAVDLCPKQVPPDVVKRVEAAIKQQGSGARPAAGPLAPAPAAPAKAPPK